MQGTELIKEEERREFDGRRKAIIVSVSDYSGNLQRLDFCQKDGEEMRDLLLSLGYNISDKCQLIGQVKYEIMREAIIDFFTDPNTKAEDTLLFYFSGHGIPDVDGDMYLASSEIDPDAPFRRGFSFNELTKMIQRSVSTRLVTILDCCYSGAAKISKGHQDDAAKLGTIAIDNKSVILQQGEGRCLLAASLSYQEAYGLKEENHSIFTYFLLQGLRGNENSVDIDGNVTPDSLAKYVYKAIVNLPQNKRPKQTPIRKIEAGGDIILAHYSQLAKTKVASESSLIKKSPSIIEKQEHEYSLKVTKKYHWTLLKVLMLVSAAVILVAFVSFVHVPILENNFSSSNPPANMVATSKSATVSPSRSSLNTNYVSIVRAAESPNNSSFYDPLILRIPVGRTVVWTNNDSTLHTVTSGLPNKGLIGKLFDSKFLNAGKTFTHTFDRQGTFDYYCVLHPNMTGKVSVS